MITKEWVKAALIRALKTVCQTALSLIGVNTVGLTSVDWYAVISASLLAGIVSILTSIATGLPEVTTVSELTDDEADALLDEYPESVEEDEDEEINEDEVEEEEEEEESAEESTEAE